MASGSHESLWKDWFLSLRTQGIPARLFHDAREPLRVENVTAEVRERDDGEYELRMEFDADEDGWASYEAERNARGGPGGMSFSITEPLDDVDGIGMEGLASVRIAADTHHFPDDLIIREARELAQAGPVTASKLYQFSTVPAAMAIISFMGQQGQQIPAGLLTNYIYAALQRLRRPGINPGLTLESVDEPGRRKVTAVIPEGTEPSVAARAIEAWETVANRPGIYEVTPDGSWRKISD